MKIPYKRKHLNVNLILGLVWMAWFFFGIFEKTDPNWTDYGWIIISLLYLGLYFYQIKYKYLSIENEILSLNGPFGKKIQLNEIKGIKRFAGDYILKTEKKELTINTQILDSKSLSKLNEKLKELKVECY